MKLGWSIIMSALVAGVSSQAFADVIKLNDGTEVEGQVISETEKAIKIQNFDGVITVKVSDVVIHLKRISPYEEYQERLKKIQAGDPKTHLEVALWCLDHRLWTLTRKYLADAQKAVPGDGGAGWQQKIKEVAEAEKKERNAFLELEPLKIAVGCREELKESEVATVIEGIKQMSQRLQRMTGGVMYVESVTINLGSEKGDLVYLKGFDDVVGAGGLAKDGGGFVPAKNWLSRTPLHEYAHARFFLKDEYNTTSLGAPTAEPSCSNCIMGEGDDEFCKKSNHKGTRNAPGCQELLSKMFPRLAKGFARTSAETKKAMKDLPDPEVIRVVHPKKK